MNIYDWQEETVQFSRCTWSGKGSAARAGEMFKGGSEWDCPECGQTLRFVSFATFEEVLGDPRSSPKERELVEWRVAREANFEASKLRSAEQLPDLDPPLAALVWTVVGDRPDDQVVILHGNQEIWREPSWYENFRRFEEVAVILRQKYGQTLCDLVPSRESQVDLLGDDLSARHVVERVRTSLSRWDDRSYPTPGTPAGSAPAPKHLEANTGLDDLNNQGLRLLGLGRLEEAAECFEHGLRTLAPTLFNLGLAQFRMRHFEEALANFQAATRINPSDAEYFDLVGNALLKLGRKEEAIAALEHSLKLDPRYATAHYDLGTVFQLGAAEDVVRALMCFEAALALDPNMFWAEYAIGCIHARAGRTAPALEHLELALEKGLRDFEHIEGDLDLDSLRREEQFQGLMKRFQTA